jgi:hypothetical protein
MVRIWSGPIIPWRDDSRSTETTRSWSQRAKEVWSSPLASFDMASQAVTSGRDRHDDHQAARSVVEDVDRDHYRRAAKGRLVSDWLAEIDEVDLPSPDQARASHS